MEGPGPGGERSRQQPADVAQVQPLVAEVHSALQFVWIERPPLAAVNTASIHQ
jgi:hypothetical protein